MNDQEFDAALLASFFALVAEGGWRGATIAEAARRASLPLAQARRRFPCRPAAIARLAARADAQALAAAPAEGGARDRLFDLLMQRLDVFQAHRAGVVALLKHLPFDPPLAAATSLVSLSSMGWMLEAAGISAHGPLGYLRRKGLLGVWLWTLRAWMRDESEDLSATMAALDQGLSRAAMLARCLPGGRASDDSAPDAPAGDAPAEAAG